MQKTKSQKYFTLPGSVPGCVQKIRFVSYGDRFARPAIYLQAALHADEVPGLLVMRELETMLDAADDKGDIKGRILIVPVANPIGLSQVSFGTVQGRYNAGDGANFNRNYPDLFPQLCSQLDGKLGEDSNENVRLIRDACLKLMAALTPVSAIDSMRHFLLSHAIDADLVLDLHCDDEAILHFYTSPSAFPEFRSLVEYLDCPLVLLAEISGGNPFDEASSSIWPRLAEAFPDHPIPDACIASTVELRGRVDVDETLARQDAEALYTFMIARGIINGNLPEPFQGEIAVHPLEGVARIKAPCTGVVTFNVIPGGWVKYGDTLATIYPLDQDAEPVKLISPISGLVYSRRVDRYVTAGHKICSLSGAQPFENLPGHSLLGD